MNRNEIFAQLPNVISEEQRAFYYSQGYLCLPDLIDEADLIPMREALERVVDRARHLTEPSKMYDLEKGHCAENPRLRRATYVDEVEPVIWELCSNSVLPRVAADLLGPNIRFREIMVNFKWAGGGAEVKWHQDIVFYPHTHVGTCQFLVALEDIGPEQGPLQVIPGSHKGPLIAHYDDHGNWTGAITEDELEKLPMDEAVALTGPAGTITVHHSCTVHGSARNLSDKGRPVFVITYAAADAIPYTAAPYPSANYGKIVMGEEPGYAHHEELRMPLPPDWSDGYTSIFAHQDKIEAAE